MYHDIGPAPPHLREDMRRLRRAFLLALAFAAALWWIKMLEALVPIDLISYGIYPRTLTGLLGVPTAPFIHGSLAHLISNTPPIVILGTALLYGYPRAARLVIPVVLRWISDCFEACCNVRGEGFPADVLQIVGGFVAVCAVG